MYNVFLSTRGNSEIVFRGEKEEACKYADSLRRQCKTTDPDGVEIDCYIKSDEEIEKEAEAKSFFDTLTEEDKKDFIEVNGRKYIRKIYEHTLRG